MAESGACCAIDVLNSKDRVLMFLVERVDMPETVRAIVGEGANHSVIGEDGISVLMRALWHRKFVNARELILLGADVHFRSTHEGSYGATALHVAAFVGAREIAELLLQKGAAKNVTDADGDTPLSAAIKRGHTAVVDLLG